MKKYIKLAENNKNVNYIKLEVKYNLGGVNWATYQDEDRGYYIHVTPVKLENRGSYNMESFGAFTGIKAIVKPVKRKSSKAEQEAIKIAEANEAMLIKQVLDFNKLQLAE